MSAPTLDSATYAIGSGGVTMECFLAVNVSNALMVMMTFVESGAVASPGAMVAAVVSTTGTPVTWIKRHRTPGTGLKAYVDVWYAVAVTSGVYGVKVTYNSGYDDAAMVVNSFAGVSTATPFDINETLPQTTTYNTPGTPSVTGVTTNQAEAMLLWYVGTNSNGTGVTGSAVALGFPTINVSDNAGGTYWAKVRVGASRLTVQPSISDVFQWADNVGSVDGGENTRNISYFDALRPFGAVDGGGSGGTPSPNDPGAQSIIQA